MHRNRILALALAGIMFISGAGSVSAANGAELPEENPAGYALNSAQDDFAETDKAEDDEDHEGGVSLEGGAGEDGGHFEEASKGGVTLEDPDDERDDAKAGGTDAAQDDAEAGGAGDAQDDAEGGSADAAMDDAEGGVEDEAPDGEIPGGSDEAMDEEDSTETGDVSDENTPGTPDISAGEDSAKESREYPTGYVPEENPVEIIHNEPKDPLLHGEDDLPASYRTELLPPLHDQSPYGTCWAFATTALEEISLLKSGIMTSPDLSELHLAYFSYNTVTDPLGGTAPDYYRITETAECWTKAATIIMHSLSLHPGWEQRMRTPQNTAGMRFLPTAQGFRRI